MSLEIASNEILCVVGESGSGKSMMANAVMRLLPNEVTIDGGRVMFEGRDLCAASVAEMREVRGAGTAPRPRRKWKPASCITRHSRG